MQRNDILRCGDRDLDLSQPRVMGILNVTPDSFSDGGRFISPDSAVRQAIQMLQEGASLIDIGGESTRPGAAPVSEQEELDRVMPVIEVLRRETDAILSVDTSTPAVMGAAARAGAGLLNDVRSLQRPGALEVAQKSGLPVCLMHMRKEPDSMQNNPFYQDVVNDVMQFLQQRVEACLAAGIERSRLLVDPGFGFGKSLQHNLLLMNRLEALNAFQLPVLVGVSRKSMVGAVLDKPVEDRLFGSLALAVMAVQKGARIIRVHDVGPTVDALKMARAVMQASNDQETKDL